MLGYPILKRKNMAGYVLQAQLISNPLVGKLSVFMLANERHGCRLRSEAVFTHVNVE